MFLKLNFQSKEGAQLTVTCSQSTIEALKKDMRYVPS